MNTMASGEVLRATSPSAMLKATHKRGRSRQRRLRMPETPRRRGLVLGHHYTCCSTPPVCLGGRRPVDVRLHGIFAPCTSRRCLRPPALRLLHCFVCAMTWSPGVRSANAKAQLRGSVVRGCGQKTYARGVVGHSRLHQREGARVLAGPIAPLGTYGCEHPASEARPATLLPASILHHV